MGYTGFDSQFTIHRKRNLYAIQFLMYLDGKDSAAASWPDREDTAIDPTVGSGQLAPLGYLPQGSGALTGNLGVSGDTITAFTVAVVLSRDELSNNEGILQGLFGSTYYPRLYFNGTTLNCKVKLDGSIITVAVANVGSYLKVGQPSLIVFRGSAAAGCEVLIDGVSRGTDATTGTSFDVGVGDFTLCTDSALGYSQTGALRLVAACASKLTDAQLLAWRTMLEYEGVFDLWRDDFVKWSSSETFLTGAEQIGSSPYYATIVES